MDSGYYAACTALVARTQALDTIANNLANVSTNGFKASHNVFGAMLATSGNSALSVLNEDANNYGILSGNQLDTSQGSLVNTGNNLDFAVEGPGYFQVQGPGTSALYTRGGSFQISSKGQLVTAAGDPVLGDNSKPISIPPGAMTISGDGTISVDGAVAGKLKLVEFGANANMQSVGGSYYTVSGDPGAPAKNSSIHQGMLESSNVNPVTSTIELITAQRQVETMRHVLTMVNTEMDKAAAQDLPRVD